MSTKKEKCCEKCGLHKHQEGDTCWCFSTNTPMSGCWKSLNCQCHKSKNIEWEKKVNDFRNGVQDAPDTDEYIRENLPRVLSQAITTAVAKRELEIAEEVEKKSFRGFAPYEQDYLIKKEDVLSILKH